MPLPVLSIAQMAEWEKATWATGQTEIEVIRRVGCALARKALNLTQRGDLVLILAGKGNNGQDAHNARAHLGDRRVDLLDVADPAADLAKLDAFLCLHPVLIIDGLFGTGLNRPLSPEWVQFIQRVNTAACQVLAVDVPSGLNAETGEPMGGAIEACITLTVGAPKRGLLRESAWPYVGRLEVATDVGLVPCPVTSEFQWTLPEDFGSYPPPRAAATHKGSYGHVAIVAGSLGFHGSSILAARGAQRARPGLITLHVLEPIYRVVASQLQSVMVSPWEPDTKLPGPWTAILLGPGLAAAGLPDQIKMLTRLLWRDAAQPIIVDASALDWLPLDVAPRNVIRVITPHPGEAARLLRTTSQKVQADRPAAVREISKRFSNCWVVLKGHQTLMGRNAGEIYVNSSGNPYLAQGGSGDVLSGFIAGLLAQPALQTDVAKTLRYAVWSHGAAADRLQSTRPNWVVEELVAELG